MVLTYIKRLLLVAVLQSGCATKEDNAVYAVQPNQPTSITQPTLSTYQVAASVSQPTPVASIPSSIPAGNTKSCAKELTFEVYSERYPKRLPDIISATVSCTVTVQQDAELGLIAVVDVSLNDFSRAWLSLPEINEAMIESNTKPKTLRSLHLIVKLSKEEVLIPLLVSCGDSSQRVTIKLSPKKKQNFHLSIQ